MSVTWAGVFRRAFAAARPPKPPPTITTCGNWLFILAPFTWGWESVNFPVQVVSPDTRRGNLARAAAPSPWRGSPVVHSDDAIGRGGVLHQHCIEVVQRLVPHRKKC